MKISKDQLRKIIAEEVREHVKKKLVSESKSAPRTVKATPSMLKRIIAEEAAKINEMDPGRPIDGSHDPLDHPDNEGVDYEDLDQLEDKYAEDAARDEAERLQDDSKSEPRYKINMSFLSISPKGRLEDYSTGEVLLDLSYGAYLDRPRTGMPLDAESKKKIDCASMLRSKCGRGNYYLDRHHHAILDCLKKCGIVDEDAELRHFVVVDDEH